MYAYVASICLVCLWIAVIFIGMAYVSLNLHKDNIIIAILLSRLIGDSVELHAVALSLSN
jgi:hypothetical protein